MIPQKKLQNREFSSQKQNKIQKSPAANKRSTTRSTTRRKAPARRLRMSPIFCLMVVTVVIVGLFIGYLSQYTALTRANYRLGELEGELAELQNRGRNLELEVSRLKSPRRIERIAKNELNMSEADKVMLVSVNTGFPVAREYGNGYWSYDELLSLPAEFVHRVGEWWNETYGVYACTLDD